MLHLLQFRPFLSDPHPAEVKDNDHGCGSQAVHEHRGIVEVDVRTPRPSMEASADLRAQGRLRAHCQPRSVLIDEVLDLPGRGVRQSRQVPVGDIVPALVGGAGQRASLGDMAFDQCPETLAGIRLAVVLDLRAQPLILAPAREDVIGEVLNEPQCPDQQPSSPTSKVNSLRGGSSTACRLLSARSL